MADVVGEFSRLWDSEAATVAGYGTAAPSFRHLIFSDGQTKRLVGYQRLALHFKWALGEVFDVFSGASDVQVRVQLTWQLTCTYI